MLASFIVGARAVVILCGMHHCRPQLLIVGNLTIDVVDGKRALVR